MDWLKTLTRYTLALILPPLAVISCGHSFRTILTNILLTFLIFPGIIHAFILVRSYESEIEKGQWAEIQASVKTETGTSGLDLSRSQHSNQTYKVAREGDILGEYSWNQIQQSIEDGSLVPTDFYFNGTDWTPIKVPKELSSFHQEANLFRKIFPVLIPDRKQKKQRQELRDMKAYSGGPYALYLRPFFTDHFAIFRHPTRRGKIGPEEFVGETLEEHINVVQIGGSAETVGTSRRYTTDKDWKEVMIKGVTEAAVIVMMPSLDAYPTLIKKSGMATMWELCFLIETGAIRRTIILMPESYWPHLRTHNGDQSKSYSWEWNNARKISESFGLLLPKFSAGGAVMTFKEENEKWCVDRIGYGKKSIRYQLASELLSAYKQIVTIQHI